jgi:hypothetical protein
VSNEPRKSVLSELANGNTLLFAALNYSRRGFSVIPIRPGGKMAACRWKDYQVRPPTISELRSWFANDCARPGGLAVILGRVSGDLVCRDFDMLTSYTAWAETRPDLAGSLPTVITGRGRHVYFRANVQRITNLGDGELRGAGYCLLPPSRHPSGTSYEWCVALPAGPVPFVEDLDEAGLATAWSRGTERTERTEITEIRRQ